MLLFVFILFIIADGAAGAGGGGGGGGVPDLENMTDEELARFLSANQDFSSTW
jgi:hypothetical protein